MLNCFRVYKGYIHILNCILELAWSKEMKLTLEQQFITFMLFVLHSQYHVCWCFGNFRCPGISMNGIDPQSHNILSPALYEFTYSISCVYPIKYAHSFVTWGQFWPSDIMVACVCLSVCFVITILADVLILNSLAPGSSECDSKNGIFNLALLTGIFRFSHDDALRWMPRDLTDDKSTLVQVMAWCRQATSHYLSQCWPRSMSPYGLTRPHWVNGARLSAHTVMHTKLIHCGLVMPYGDTDLGQYWLSLLLPGGTKPLPEPTLTYHWSGSMAFIWGYHHD